MARKAEGTEVLEKGDIFFFYIPKVEKEEVRGEEDIQRFYIVLSPDKKKVYRLIAVGQKAMPEAGNGGQRNWGFVSKIGHKPEEVEDELDKRVYETKTRGERERQAGRPAGEGRYEIVRHGDHTHLAYSLELPKKPAEVQRELNIEDEASYILSVKNPEKPSPPQAGLKGAQKADFPKRLMDVFRGRRFANADPPDLLDYEGAEIMLIGAKESPEEELGIKIDTENETESSAEIFRDLKLERDQHKTEPLFKGRWA